MSSPNPLQFRLRHLLLVMCVMAVGSAVLAPWLRDLSRGQWLRLGSSLGLAGGVWAVAFMLVGSFYNRARRQLGAVHWALRGSIRGQGKLLPQLIPYYQLVVAALLAIACSIADLAITNQQPFPVARLLFSFQFGVMAAQGLLWLRCPLDRVLIGENGIMASNSFLPWEKILYSWEKEGRPTPILLRTRDWAVYELQVPTELEESIVGFLHTRAALWTNPRRSKRA